MTPGQAAHRKWWDLITSPKAHVEWDNLPIESQQAWEAIAQAGIDAQVTCACEGRLCPICH